MEAGKRHLPLNYDAKHVLGWLPQPGVFPFKVLSCAATVFKTGSEGVRIHLEVEAGASAALKCWDNIVFSQKTTWKMYDLCLSTGVRFDPPCEESHLEGKSGRAQFATEEYDGYVGLRVVRYLHEKSKSDRPQEPPASGDRTRLIRRE